MKMKRLLCIVLTLMTVFSLLALSAFATTYTIVADGLTVADSKNNSSYADGVVTITGVGGRISATENTVTITNAGTTKANVTFDYVATGYGSFSESAASGHIDINMEAGATRTMKIKGTSSVLSGGTDGVLKLSNFTYTALVEGVATITHNDLGSISVDGAAFASGSTTGTLTEAGSTLVATPVSGANFVAWVNADNNEVLSQNKTFLLKPYATSMNIRAVFTTADQAPYFMTNAIVYNDLSAALTAASSGDKKVVAMSSGVLLAGSTYNIPSGVTLLVPYSAADLAIGTSTTIDDSGGQGGTMMDANVTFATKDSEGINNSAVTGVMEPDTSVTYTITIPSETTVNVSGKMVVGGTLVAGTNSTTGVCAATGGAHSNIQLNGTINVKSGGVLSTCGYIRGSGTINAESGATVYQPFILMDHKDGHYLYAAKQENRFPIYRYSMQNIQTKLVMNSGSDMYGYSLVFTRKNSFASARFNPTSAHVVGAQGESAFFQLSNGNITMTYDSGKALSVSSGANSTGYYNKIGRTNMTFAGDVALGSIEISVVVLGSNYNMSSTGSEIPLAYNFNMVQQSGTFSVNNNMALLPGATFTVKEGAAMTIASGKSLTVYDGLRDYAARADSVTLDGDDETGGTWPNYHYPSTADLQKAGFSSTAELIINGTLTVNGNLGGMVQTNGTTGKIVMGSSAGSSATGTFGMQNEKADVLVMTINGSCGKTVRTLAPQVFTANSATPIQLEAGKSYVATGNGTNTINNYTYSVYASHTGDATTESKSNLNATVKGTWKCETCIDDDVDHTCDICGNVSECADAEPVDHNCDICAKPLTECADGDDEDTLCDVCGKNFCAHEGEITSFAQVDPTCENDGTKAYWQCGDCGFCFADETCATEIPDLAAWLAGDGKIGKTGHKYAVTGYAWAEDYSKVTASGVCANDESHAATLDSGSVTNLRTEPTCSAPGSIVYTAAFAENAEWTNLEQQTADVTLSVSENAHADTDQDHVCDNGCGAELGTHADGDDANHTCDYCNGDVGETCADANNDHKCDECAETTSTCVDAGKDHVCDFEGCKAAMGEHKNGEKTHICAYCGQVASACADADGDGDHKCDVCDADYGTCNADAVIPAVDPTCTKTGLTAGTKCSECGAVQTAQTTVDALGHKYNAVVTDPTCENGGYTTYTCTACGDSYVDNETSAAGHNYESVVTSPTCEEKGYTTYTCNCGHTYTGNEVNALGHNYEEKTTTEATCTAEGVKTFTCKNDGEHTYTEAIPVKDHTPGAEADCENAQICTVCKAELNPALGHKDENLDHTCDNGCSVTQGEHVDSGKDHKCDYGCSVAIGTCEDKDLDHACDYGCGKKYGEHSDSATDEDHVCDYGCKAILEECSDVTTDQDHSCDVCDKENVTDHEYTSEVTKPTCEEKGYTTYTCNCGHTYTGDEVDALGHSYTSEVTKQPTCTEKGEKTFTCANCGDTYTEEIEANGHTLSQVAAKAPTCTDAGYEAYVYCSVCDYTTYKAVDATGHTEGETVVENNVAPDCVNDGSYDNVVYCTVCKAELSRETVTVDALGHDMQETAAAVAPTCETAGTTAVYTCGNGCGKTEGGEAIDALGHKMEKTADAVAPDCENTGKTEVLTCANGCGKTEGGEAIDALGHKDKNTDKDHNCDNCGKEDITKHELVAGNPVAPTCTAAGYTPYACDCGESEMRDEVAATGHIFLTYTEDEGGATETAVCANNCGMTNNRKVAEDNSGVVIKAPKPEGGEGTEPQTEAKVTVGGDILNEIVKDDQKQNSLEFRSEVANMTFNWHALLKIIADHVTEQANAAVEFVAQNVTDETHENKLVFDLHLAVNGEKVDHTDFGEGSGEVEVDLPLDGLEVPEGKTVKIVYVDDNGGRHDMGGEFDRHNHRVKFKTHHFSTYEAVIEEEDAQETVAVTVENMTNGVASVNAPAGTVGEAYTLTVSAEMACVVLVQDSEGNYEPLVATSVGDNTYSFTTVLEEGMTFVVAVKGDISLDSVVDGVDAARAALYFAQKITLDAVNVAVGDLDGDNVITGVDAARAALAFAKKITIAW